MFFSFISLFELALLVTGGVLLFHRWGYSIAHALFLGIVVTLMALSLAFQTSFLLGIPGLSFPVEGVLITGAIVMVYRERLRLVGICSSLFMFMRCYKVTCGIVIFCFAYLAMQAFLLPEGNADSMRYNMTRVLLFQQECSMFLTNITEFHQAVQPVGGDILSHMFLRYHTDYGLAMISFLAYVSIGLGAYALARDHASQRVAWTVMLIAVSFPLLVRQATGTKPDILATSVVVLCLLSAERMLHRPNLRDGLLLVLGLSFGMSIKTTFVAFMVPFVPVFAGLFVYRHGLRWSIGLRKRSWLLIIFVIPMILIFSQMWLFMHNYIQWGHWAGPIKFVEAHSNKDGLSGAIANVLRYGVQSMHLMTPTDVLSKMLIGEQISNLLERAYEMVLYPVIGDSGAAWPNVVMPFSLSDQSWGDGENGAWFGPFGFLFVIPALVLSLVRGTSYLRMAGIVLVAYVVILSWQVAWMPWNGRFFGPVFVGSAGCLGFWLARWRTRWGIHTVQIAALSILIYCCAVNQAKSLLGPGAMRKSAQQLTLAPGLIEQSIWAQTNWGSDRHFYARRYYGNNRVAEFINMVGPNARVAVVSRQLGWLFHFMLYRQDVHFVPLNDKTLGMDSLEGFDYLLCINCDYEEFYMPERHELLFEYNPEKYIWEVPLGEYVRPGALVRL